MPGTRHTTAALTFNARGVKMGWPSRIHVKVDQAGCEISRVRIGGTSVLVGEGCARTL